MRNRTDKMKNENEEFYVVEAVLYEKNKPFEEQYFEFTTYAVCDNWDIARQIEIKDGPRGRKDLLKSRILGPFPLQTKELI